MTPVPSFFGQISTEAQAWFRERGHIRTFGRNEALFFEGDAASATFIIEEGLVRVERFAFNGTQQVLTLVGRGDLVGDVSLMGGSARTANAVAIEPTRALAIPAQVMNEALGSMAEVPLAIARLLADRLRALTDQLVEVTSGTAQTRTAARLVELVEAVAGHADGPIDIEASVTQADLAAWAGLSREGVVKALRELREAGIIETSRKKFRVLDVHRLRDAAIAAD